jgi:NADH-quinone oxidoreductase subunit J
VYAGAIMVLFVFVIMLLNLPREEVRWAAFDTRRILVAAILGAGLLGELILMLIHGGAHGAAELSPGFGTTEVVGRLLFTQYLFPFEVTSIILLVAIVGAMVLAKGHYGK